MIVSMKMVDAKAWIMMRLTRMRCPIVEEMTAMGIAHSKTC
jgi:hypothetical protein